MVLTHICGQDPSHTWAPGGVGLLVCQRCTGLYVGISVAALGHLCLRPVIGRRFLEWHGAFLILMIPFGYHWLPQGPTLRTLTGFGFGLAVFTFLWLPLDDWLRRHCPEQLPEPEIKISSRPLLYGLWASVLSLALPVLGENGGGLVAILLTFSTLLGVVVIVALICIDLALGTLGAFRLWAPRRKHEPSE